MNNATVTDKIEKISIVITDVDGVLTDGGMYYCENGDELKKFNVRDGAGVALLKAAGFKVGAISGEQLTLIERRLQKMGMDFSYLGIKDKLGCLTQVLEEYACDRQSVAYIGDEINDHAILGNVGLFLAPADACKDILSRADHVLKARGGEGVLREVAEFLLSRSGHYEEAIAHYVTGIQQHEPDVEC